MKTEELMIVTELLKNNALGVWPCIYAEHIDLSYDAPPYGTIEDGYVVWVYERYDGENEEESVPLCEGELDYELVYNKLVEAGIDLKNNQKGQLI